MQAGGSKGGKSKKVGAARAGGAMQASAGGAQVTAADYRSSCRLAVAARAMARRLVLMQAAV
jgi:hypothetical protein